ncbi:conserved hypothetical protein [Streptomyces lividans TK24]|nr:conserved hypothetical protein [Streptomyces lividans TK24]
MSVLDARSLNRAALARQLLLDRADHPVLGAVAHLGGMQAQEPQEPFVGLWSRLRDFAPRALDDLLTGRRVVRTHLMRRTVHLVTAEDVLAWRSRHDAMLRGRVLGTYRRELAGVDLDELAAAGRAVLADGEPRSMGDLARAVAARWPDAGPRPLGELLVAALIPTVQLPPRGLWRTRAGVRNAPVADWLGRDVDPPAPPGTDPVGEELVLRYLAAFGPAASADLRAWCGLAGLFCFLSRRCAENWSPSATSGAGNCWTCPAPRGPTPAPRHRCGSCPPSTTRSSATRTAAGSSATRTAACRSPAPASSSSTGGSRRPGPSRTAR